VKKNSLRKPIFYKLPGLWGFALHPYPVRFDMKNIVTGVDNIRHDVFLSPGLRIATTKLVICLLARYSGCETILKVNSSDWVKTKSRFKRFCRDVMLDAVDKSKKNDIVQIDMLAQIAIAKMSLETIRHQFDKLVHRIKIDIRNQGLSHHHQDKAPLQLKKKLSAIQQNKNEIILQTDRELFQYFVDVQNESLNNMRVSTYGEEAVIPNEVFFNPIRSKECLHDEFFMINEYVLLSSRSQDPDNYQTLLRQLKLFFKMCGLQYGSGALHLLKRKNRMSQEEEDWEINSFLKQIDNINLLFDWFESEKRCQIIRKDKKRKKEYKALKKQTKKQARLLNFLFHNFKRVGLIDKIVAAYNIKSVILDYCPPLSPQQILQFVINPKARKTVIAQLKRMKEFYGKTFALKPLWDVIKNVKKIKLYNRKKYLLRFLHDFTRYHRDFENFVLLNEVLEQINLVADKKTLRLSRANNTLYDFLLPQEQRKQKTPVKSHVIIKADVRGSTDLTFKMKQKGLNPASYFSLNFFDPISDILAEYGAIKIFIEGDAMILSILEREGTRTRWHTVACACGLAKNMLAIIHQTNKKSRQHGLPVFELGIGISFENSAPTFLFDGDHRIMISSAINLADRLSGCSKMVRQRLKPRNKPFNLYVFQPRLEKASRATVDDLAVRYNVNGIELNLLGFQKLSEEIDLKEMQCSIPALQKEKIKVYTGKYPTLSGQYQRLVIREERIPEVKPESLKVLRMTSRYYYEVCTHPGLYEYVENVLNTDT